MATTFTPDENARMVLRIYKHFGTRAGEVLRPNNFTAMAAAWGLRTSDITDGLKHGASVGWFEAGPNTSFRLTEAGFAAI
jgi:hypothetical protein